MCTLLEIIEVDTSVQSNLVSISMSIPTHRDFVDTIVIVLLTNRKCDALELSSQSNFHLQQSVIRIR